MMWLLAAGAAAACGGWAWTYFQQRALREIVDAGESRASSQQTEIMEQEAEIRRLIAALEEAEARAGAAGRAKSTFLANMSHELRTPLNAIIGYSELLLEDLGGDAHEDARRIRTSAHKLLSFVGDVLEMAKMETGGLDVLPDDVDLPALVEGVCEEHRLAMAASGNAFRVEIEGSSELFRTDVQHVRAVLEAVLDNAVRFTRDGAVVVRVSEHFRGHLRSWRLAVEDTGCGISEQRLERLFEPFTTGGSTVPLQGAGLGLPRAQRLLQLLGGDLYVQSRVGEGSTFTLEIPELDAAHRSLVVSMPPTDVDSLVSAAPTPDASTEAVVSAIAVQSGAPRGPVLLVEDDIDSRRLLGGALRRAGLLVEEARNGIEALEALRRTRFAVVLLDLMMPEMDGFTVLERIHRDPDLAGLPVMVVTSLDLDVSARERLGGADVLAKRDLHDPVHIIRRVRSQLQG